MKTYKNGKVTFEMDDFVIIIGILIVAVFITLCYGMHLRLIK